MFSIKVSKKLVRGLKLQLFQFQNQDVVLVKKQKPSPQKKIEANQQFWGGGFVKWSWMMKTSNKKKNKRTLQTFNGNSGSTIRTLLLGKINPKKWQVAFVPWWYRVSPIFRIVSGDYGKPWNFLGTKSSVTSAKSSLRHQLHDAGGEGGR